MHTLYFVCLDGDHHIAYIRRLEYTSSVTTALRTFKAQIFQALAHPTRIAIVEALHDGELTAGKLMERLQIEQANLSQHLAVLRARQVSSIGRSAIRSITPYAIRC